MRVILLRTRLVSNGSSGAVRVCGDEGEIFPGASLTVRGEARPGVWLLVGPPKVGKASFCLRFICDRLLEGNDCVYVLTNAPPEELVSNIIVAEPELEGRVEELLHIVDCYSWRFRDLGSDQLFSSPSNLIDLSIKIKKIVESELVSKESFGFVIDTVSTLALEAGPASTVEFLQLLVGRLKVSNGFGVCALEEGVHHESFGNTLRFIFDGVFEMSFLEDGGKVDKRFRVFSLPRVEYTTEWIKFQLLPRGIVFE